jgi:signal transduction histidine kinase
MYQKNYKRSLQYFNTVVALSTQIKDSLRLGHALNNIGLTHGYAENFDVEYEYYEKASEIFRKIGEKEGYANTLLNKATVHTANGEFDKADKLYQEAMKIYIDLGNDIAISMTLQSMSENAFEAKKYPTAIKYAHKALKISKTKGFKAEEASSLNLLQNIYKHLQKYDSAYYYLNQCRLINNEIFNAEKSKISSELEKKYETEIKEKTIIELQQQNQIKELQATTSKQWQIVLIVILVFLVSLLVFLYNRFQIKKKSAKLLDQKNTELEQLNRFKDKMFAVISHDLRNPVNAFQMILQSLNQTLDHASKEDIKEVLETTYQSATELKSLLTNLLDWSLIQIGKMPINLQKVDLEQITQQVIKQLNSMANQKSIFIELDIIHKYAWMDQSMLLIVLRNVLSNAIKFSNKNGKIRIFTAFENGKILLSIQDFGIGMKPEDAALLFEQKTDMRMIGNSEQKGTGLGLLICKELLEKNNGSIYVRSELSKGSTFVLVLPVSA